MIYLEDKYLNIIEKILSKYPYTFYLFGSRIKGKTKRSSDVDICFKDSIPLAFQAHIEEDFELSDLPFTIDLVDLNLCSESFRKNIEQHYFLIKTA